MPIGDLKNAEAVLAIVRDVLPREVESDGHHEDWNVIAPALVAVVADLFEGILSSTPPRGRIRAEVLARSLAEYAIVFAWLAGPEGGRDTRIKRLVRSEYIHRTKAANKLGDQIAVREDYKRLFEAGRLPEILLDESTKEFMAPLIEDESLKALPNALEMAFEADQVWMPKIELVNENPYAMVYFTVFTGSSSTTHPSVTGIDRMVTGDGGKLLVGAPQLLGESGGPYAGGYLALLNTLWVASLTLEWPAQDSLREAIKSI